MLLGPFHVVALVLAVAGFAKVRRPDATANALGSFGSIPRVRFLGLAEMGIGVAAMWFGAAAVGLMIAGLYAAFGIWALARRNTSCGCFGNSSTIGSIHVVTNALSATIAASAVVADVPGLATAMTEDWAEGGLLLASVLIGAAAVVLLLNRPVLTPATKFEFATTADWQPSRSWLDRLTNRTTDFAQTAVSRRAFLGRAALIGTALAVAPTRFVLRPVSAYAAICECQGQDCSCGSLCCDGYTEFCCTIYGDNSCPPGSIAAGWWKADGSGFCDSGGIPQPRYYIDCNAECTTSCTCVNGFCDSSCLFCDCECGNGECGNRKACCTKFRYGQCNQDATCIGPIVCRVITCVPPWVWDPTCGTTNATDNNTRFHDAACLHEGGPPDLVVPGGVPVMGDWNGDGIATPGIFRDGTWYLSNSIDGGDADLVFSFGDRGDIPVVGDWSGNGQDTIGVFRGGLWHLRNSNDSGAADIQFLFGDWGDTPVPGDWTGDGASLPAIVRHGIWYLRYSLSSGVAEHSYPFGLATDIPLAADFNGDGFASPGVFRDGKWYIRNRNDFGAPDIEFEYGLAGDIPLVAKWSTNPDLLPLVVRGPDWYLRDSLDTGPGTLHIQYGTRSNQPALTPR